MKSCAESCYQIWNIIKFEISAALFTHMEWIFLYQNTTSMLPSFPNQWGGMNEKMYTTRAKIRGSVYCLMCLEQKGISQKKCNYKKLLCWVEQHSYKYHSEFVFNNMFSLIFKTSPKWNPTVFKVMANTINLLDSVLIQ
jgi:hypothetical protein